MEVEKSYIFISTDIMQPAKNCVNEDLNNDS